MLLCYWSGPLQLKLDCGPWTKMSLKPLTQDGRAFGNQLKEELQHFAPTAEWRLAGPSIKIITVVQSWRYEGMDQYFKVMSRKDGLYFG